MSKIMHAGRSLLELLLLIALGLVPVVSGLLVMVFQLETKLAENANISVQEAVFSVDQALDRMHETALQALPFAGKPCNEVISKLQDQVAGRSMVRSLTLINGNQAYCSTTSDSLAGLSSFAVSGRQVELAYGSRAEASELLVNFYLSGNDNGVIVTAYALQLRNELDGFQDGLTLLLEFGDRYIWSHGDSRDRQPPSQSEFTERALSAKYGYQVKGGYAQGYTAREARQSMLQILPSLMLVGIVTGSIVYLTLFRARANRRGTAANPA
ncbi:CSS-motif domain-containing protein [Pseudomonas putida]|uniref:CSS-motif domain-containing protein n=1 Tax=Pseudomonas putida TaxID=303 RepID=UPI0018AA9DA3|nr:CSS-motif domain-containing protein [Pseudomonas putida]MBF8669122.1 CSS-motif domain-containing protein [Pseudomonas putida]MBF8711998.1 CSS-motif domain-containing protein [Pseudomonas putida]